MFHIQFIDAIKKGNFISRINHSCKPNCATVTMSSDGKYYVGIYALRDIRFGEELTLDYG
jgi:SET domain-containing protein